MGTDRLWTFHLFGVKTKSLQQWIENVILFIIVLHSDSGYGIKDRPFYLLNV